MAMGTRRVTCSKEQGMMKMSCSEGCDDRGPFWILILYRVPLNNTIQSVQGKLQQLCLCQHQKHVPLLVVKEDSTQHSRRRF